jgi:hypothetical protein
LNAGVGQRRNGIFGPEKVVSWEKDKMINGCFNKRRQKDRTNSKGNQHLFYTEQSP